jgi:hypothetical protein
LKRATRFIISSRVHTRRFRQSPMILSSSLEIHSASAFVSFWEAQRQARGIISIRAGS